MMIINNTGNNKKNNNKNLQRQSQGKYYHSNNPRYFIPILCIIGICIISALYIFGFEKNYSHHKTPTAIPKAIPAPDRGKIVDRNNVTLATNMPYWNVYLDIYHLCPVIIGKPTSRQEKQKIQQEERIKKIIALLRPQYPHITKVSFQCSDYVDEAKTKANGRLILLPKTQAKVLLAKDIDYKMYLKLGILNPDTLLALDIVNKRIYPESAENSSYLDFLGIAKMVKGNKKEKTQDHVEGKSGIEYQYNNVLSQGKDLQLSIDLALQKDLHELLHDALTKYNGVGVTGIILNPHTGEVYSADTVGDMSGGDKDQQNKNQIIFPTAQIALTFGSVMKPIVIAEALSKGVMFGNHHLTLNTVLDTRTYSVSGIKVVDDHQHNSLNVLDVIKYSSNVGASKIASRLGSNGLYNLFKTLNIGQRNPALPKFFTGEGYGRMPGKTPNDWKSYNTPRMGYGYDITASPIFLLSAYSAFFNNGYYIVPTLERVSKNHPIQVLKIFTEQSSSNIRKALLAVTEKGGTGYSARIPGYEVMGKTGTAQMYVNRTYDNNRYLSSFIGYVRGQNGDLLILVSIAQKPKTSGYYASQTATQLFKEVALSAFQRLGIKPLNNHS